MNSTTFRSTLLSVASFGCGAVAVHTASSARAEPSDAVVESSAQLAAPAPATALLVRRNANTSNNAVRISPPTATGTVRVDFGNFTTQVPVQKAGTTLNCSPSGSFHISTGTNQGSCTTDFAGGTATCTDGTNKSTAKCGSGCGNTSGSGDCTQG